MEKIYSGVGARKTPLPILDFMKSLARYLSMRGYKLRSGGADGADTAFECGARGFNGFNCKEIYLPWANFNKHPSHLFNVSEEAIQMARRYHPAWDRLSQGAEKLMGRNSHILFGEKMDVPSNFVVCWTPNAKVTGGTGQMIRMAVDHQVTVFNLADGEQYGYLSNCIFENKLPEFGESRFSSIRRNQGFDQQV